MSSVDSDPFFSLSNSSSTWNACIGPQGEETNYIEGYIEAALLLCETLMANRLLMQRDTLAMPILYNGRHAIELILKYTAKNLSRLNLAREYSTLNHDILAIWQHLHEANVPDKEIRQCLRKLEIYVKSMAQIDNDGQEFRYAETRDGQQSLQNNPILDIENVKNHLGVIKDVIKKILIRLNDLEDEIRTGIYTNRASRKDLLEIARILGNQSTWRDEEFTAKKQSIMENFGLGSHAFCDAVNKIKSSRGLSVLIGVEGAFIYLTDEDIHKFIAEWHIWHPDHAETSDPVNSVTLSQIDMASLIEHAQKTSLICEQTASWLTSEKMADLHALFDIGRNNGFMELYDKKVALAIREYNSQQLIREGIRYLLEKTNLLPCLQNSCRKLGKFALAAELT